MRYRLFQTAVLIAWLAILFTAPVSIEAQAARMVASPAAAAKLRGNVLREAVDPCLGQHWQWVADPLHPEWPRRLLLVDSTASPVASAPVASGSAASRSAASGSVREEASLPSKQTILIRSGDRITVYQDNGIVRARLQAIALESAAAGQPLHVRLAITTDPHQGANFVLTSFGPVIQVTATNLREAAWNLTSTESISTEQSR